MKDTFTVKEIMDGTGLTRQRVHQLIKRWGIPVTRENKYFLLKWQDLLRIADNATMLNFLKTTLEKERQFLEKVHDYQEENERAIHLGKAIEHTIILLEGEPDYSKDWEGWCRWSKAVGYFSNLGISKKEAAKQGSVVENKAPVSSGEG